MKEAQTLRRTRVLLALLLATGTGGCQDGCMGTTRVGACATAGQQCDLGSGVLGVCFDAACRPGQPPPCFTCAKQH